MVMEEKLFRFACSAMSIASETEYSRNVAIERIVVNIICSEYAESVFFIEDAIRCVSGYGLREDGVRQAIERLRSQGIIVFNEETNNLRVSESYQSQILSSKSRIQAALERTVLDITGTGPTASQYEITENFIFSILIKLTSRYGYVLGQRIANRSYDSDYLKLDDLINIIQEVLLDFPDIELDLTNIVEDIISLLKEKNENLSRLLFNLVQNFYSLQILGADIPIDFFSEKAFGNAKLLLDTNALVPILYEKERHHRSINEFISISEELVSEICTTEITIEELLGEIDRRRTTFLETVDTIPEDMIDEIRDPVFLEWLIYKNDNPSARPIDFVSKWSAPRTLLEELNIEILDLPIEGLIGYTEETLEKWKQIINQASIDIRNRPKGNFTQFHDAYLFMVVRDIRKGTNDESASWMITLDNSLNRASDEIQPPGSVPFSITLDEFLQTISPFIRKEANRKPFEDLFLDLMVNRILPSEAYFTLDNFRIFTTFAYNASKLPSPIIRQVIRHIQNIVLHDGGLTEENRPLVAHELAKIFANPEEYFADWKVSYEVQISELKKKLEVVQEQHRSEILEIENRHTTELEDLRAKVSKSLDEKETHIQKLSSEIDDQRERLSQIEEEKTIWKTIVIRLTSLFIGLFISVFLWILGTGYLNIIILIVVQIGIIIGVGSFCIKNSHRQIYFFIGALFISLIALISQALLVQS